MSVIKIIVSKDAVSGGAVDNPNTSAPDSAKINNNENQAVANDDKKINLKKGIIVANTVAVAKAGFSFAVANYGDLTGDYAGGVRLQETLEFAGAVGSIVTSFAVGGIGAGIGTTVAVAISYATSVASNAIKIDKANREKSVLRERYGVALNNGGR